MLFELIAHRYERRSLLITANQPFSQWDSIFTDSMMTVAAIDRLIHHATIIEMQAESFRKQFVLPFFYLYYSDLLNSVGRSPNPAGLQNRT